MVRLGGDVMFCVPCFVTCCSIPAPPPPPRPVTPQLPPPTAHSEILRFLLPRHGQRRIPPERQNICGRMRGEPDAELTCADRHCQRVAPVYPSGLQKHAQTGSDVDPQAWTVAPSMFTTKCSIRQWRHFLLLNWDLQPPFSLSGVIRKLPISFSSILWLQTGNTHTRPNTQRLHLGCFKMFKS